MSVAYSGRGRDPAAGSSVAYLVPSLISGSAREFPKHGCKFGAG